MPNVIATDDTSKAVKVTLDGNAGRITAGGSGSGGSLILEDKAGVSRIKMVAGPSDPHPGLGVSTGGATQTGGVHVTTTVWKAPAESISLDGTQATATVGSDHTIGTIYLAGANGVLGASISGTGRVGLSDGKVTRIIVDGANGALTLSDDKGHSRVGLDGNLAAAGFGGQGRDGGLALFPASATSLFDWSHATITMNGGGASIGIGGNQKNGSLTVIDKHGKAQIFLDGEKGDVSLVGADCAEEFDVATACATIAPGTVVVLDDEGQIRPCTEAYDGRVVGVISGAGRFRPALILDRQPGTPGRQPVALMGKVFCLVDADAGAVRAGDLLTTAATPGHAMRATDRTRAFGAVLGKALQPLASGRALLPILVVAK